ncbi:hypothetical protein CLU79DRAFT_890506 [Phycomyces nitens]|nr:hypothetical protein CLU79DRAFT_890506 [Phycomyces nitens]
MPPSPLTQRPAGAAIPVAHVRSLIPSSRVPFPTQRSYSAAIFVLLQALKAYDIYTAYTASYPEQYSGFMLKWWLFDIAYLIALWIAKIPWLQFSGIKTIVFCLGFMFLDALIFEIPVMAVIGTLINVTWGEMFGQQLGASRAKMVNVKDVLFNSSHILGRHTVHILPYGTAKLNYQDEVYCLSQEEIDKKDIHIPIILNNTIPKKLTISRLDFDQKTRRAIHFHGSDLHRATEVGQEKQGVELYYIKVRKPGVYKLENIISKDGSDVRLYSRQAYVFICPTAQLIPKPNYDYCSGEKDTLQLRLEGVPPFKVTYIRRVGGDTLARTVDRVQPDGFDSPLMKISGGLKAADQTFFQPQSHQDYNWATNQQVSVDLDIFFEKATRHEYSVTTIVDGAGNEVKLGDSIRQNFDVHPHPTAQFGCSSTNPVQLLIGAEKTTIPLKLEGSGAWNVTYQFTPEGSQSEPQEPQLKQVGLGQSSLDVSATGEYKLLGVVDKYCKGNVLFPSTCQVVQPPLPVAKVSQTSIPSECAGNNEIGMRFLVELQGAPPFNLEYQVLKQTPNGRIVVEHKREKINQSRHIFTYLPSNSGEYTYEFTSLDDAIYKRQDPKIKPIKQVVRPQPSARFSRKLQEKNNLRTCVGDNINLDVELSGTGPFTLFWKLGKQVYSDFVDDNKFTIEIPHIAKAGRHVVSLIKIQDSNDCVKELEARDVVIDVRKDRPTASFYPDNVKGTTLEVTEGTPVKLPLRLTGEGPWKIAYRNVELDGSGKRTITMRSPNEPLTVRDAGHYELLGVEDSICKGVVSPPNYLIQWANRPTLSILNDPKDAEQDAYVHPPVCKGTGDALDLSFSGHAPYFAFYNRFLTPTGSSVREFIGNDRISSGLSRSHLPLDTQKSGTYTYEFFQLSDQRYNQPLTIAPLVVNHKVYENPTMRFAASRTNLNLCVGEALDTVDPIWIELTGEAPFTINILFKRHSDPRGEVKTIDNIQEKKYQLKLPITAEEAGRYTIELVSVYDAHGCNAAASGPDTTVYIEALDIPVMTPTKSCPDVCVGDMIQFSLTGRPPFAISYEFNNHLENVKSSTSTLSLLADKPGNLTVVSIGDRRNQCRSFPKDITKLVHNIPSSLISGGKEIIENIHEGDMVQAVVDFVGTPPFNFEWQRSELIWDTKTSKHHKGRVLEKHSVQDIEDYRYYINTSTEGIIEITSIKDRFCQYPRVA